MCHTVDADYERKLQDRHFYYQWLIFFKPLQPQNILLTSDEPLGDIKIVDFGLSRMMSSNQEIREIMGTPEYVGKTGCGFKNSISEDFWSLDFKDPF